MAKVVLELVPEFRVDCCVYKDLFVIEFHWILNVGAPLGFAAMLGWDKYDSREYAGNY